MPIHTRFLGIDPGLRFMGWGVIELVGTKLTHVANGAIASNDRLSLAERLVELEAGLVAVIDTYQPHSAAVENAFVARDAAAALKLGQARAVALLVPARAGLSVAEYAPNHVKKAVVGAGHAGKAQIQMMVEMLLPGSRAQNEHAADALAIAICHAHAGAGAARVAQALMREAANR